jgi:D-arabinose 1-dehydrogenase-like Zn-dependent alcohol dehydrogenase
MRGAVLHAPGDVRIEERDDPTIIEPTDAIIRLSATCICGSDLWPYRGIEPIEGLTPMGHEYVGIVEEVGSEVRSLRGSQADSYSSESRFLAFRNRANSRVRPSSSTLNPWVPSRSRG